MLGQNRTYQHHLQRCPGCNQKLNVCSDPHDRGMPKPRDLTICIGCGTILVFDRLLTLKAVPMEDLEKLPQSTLEELKDQQERYRSYHGFKPIISLPPRKPS